MTERMHRLGKVKSKMQLVLEMFISCSVLTHHLSLILSMMDLKNSSSTTSTVALTDLQSQMFHLIRDFGVEKVNICPQLESEIDTCLEPLNVHMEKLK